MGGADSVGTTHRICYTVIDAMAVAETVTYAVQISVDRIMVRGTLSPPEVGGVPPSPLGGRGRVSQP